jgi:predicted carbohydrate-binding protein with CBM5 and CBM33 domain
MQAHYTIAAVAAIILPTLLAHGHGSMKDPVSRVYSIYLEGPENPKSPAAQAAVAACGTQPFYDWHELVNFIPGEAADQQDAAYEKTVRDGYLASADNDKYACLDMVRDDWPATHVEAGPRELVWYAATPHDPNVFRVWLTTEEWTPDLPLSWGQMEELEIGPISFEGQDYRFETVLPEREGRHVLYVIWQRLDPVGEGFYAACDVVFGDGDTPPSGACCFDDGCALLTDEACLGAGGQWQGANVLCSQSECGQIGQGPDSVEVHLVNSWAGGYEAAMSVTNSVGNLSMFSWELAYMSGPQISSIWSAVFEEAGGEDIIRNEVWNGALAPGESATFGFVAEGTWPPSFEHARLNGFHVHVEGAGDVETTCQGDVDGDALVNVNDLLRLLQGWGTMDHDLDLDGDMLVGINDLLIVIAAWGPCE